MLISAHVMISIVLAIHVRMFYTK